MQFQQDKIILEVQTTGEKPGTEEVALSRHRQGGVGRRRLLGREGSAVQSYFTKLAELPSQLLSQSPVSFPTKVFC